MGFCRGAKQQRRPRQMTRSVAAVAAALVGVFLVTAVRAAVIEVLYGSNSPSYCSTNQCANGLTSALNIAQDGDTLLVFPNQPLTVVPPFGVVGESAATCNIQYTAVNISSVVTYTPTFPNITTVLATIFVTQGVTIRSKCNNVRANFTLAPFISNAPTNYIYYRCPMFIVSGPTFGLWNITLSNAPCTPSSQGNLGFVYVTGNTQVSLRGIDANVTDAMLTYQSCTGGSPAGSTMTDSTIRYSGGAAVVMQAIAGSFEFARNSFQHLTNISVQPIDVPATGVPVLIGSNTSFSVTGLSAGDSINSSALTLCCQGLQTQCPTCPSANTTNPTGCPSCKKGGDPWTVFWFTILAAIIVGMAVIILVMAIAKRREHEVTRIDEDGNQNNASPVTETADAPAVDPTSANNGGGGGATAAAIPSAGGAMPGAPYRRRFYASAGSTGSY